MTCHVALCMRRHASALRPVMTQWPAGIPTLQPFSFKALLCWPGAPPTVSCAGNDVHCDREAHSDHSRTVCKGVVGCTLVLWVCLRAHSTLSTPHLPCELLCHLGNSCNRAQPPCGWSPIWTCACAAKAHTAQRSPLLLDAPWSVHAWVLAPWCAIQLYLQAACECS